MPLLASKEKCNGCEACSNVCAHHAITFIEDECGFFYPNIDEHKCVDCGLCQQKCPVLSPSNAFRIIEYNDTICYGAHHNDERKVLLSASGGIARAIYEESISQNRIVYGVRYADDFQYAYYQGTKTLDVIDSFAGSKYLMARKHDIYKEIKRHLVKGELVTFVGLPCEVGALYSVVGRNCDNLLTVELICAGTGSYKMYREILSHYEHRCKSKVANFTFRWKKLGWVPYFVKIIFQNKEQITDEYNFSLLGVGINCYKRLGCYHCIYKDENRKADITIGDFWTLSPLEPSYNHWGTSVVFVRTEKGKTFFNQMHNITSLAVDKETAIRSNPAQLKRNNPIPPYRRLYEDYAICHGFVAASQHFMPKRSWTVTLKQYIPGNVYRYVKLLGHILKSL